MTPAFSRSFTSGGGAGGVAARHPARDTFALRHTVARAAELYRDLVSGRVAGSLRAG
ncbi:MAG: hypothetical protein ABI860_04230 [Gemmatimonadales bacterium]